MLDGDNEAMCSAVTLGKVEAEGIGIKCILKSDLDN